MLLRAFKQLSSLLRLLCLQFTPLTMQIHYHTLSGLQYMFENHAIKQINVFTRFQGYTVLKSVFSSTVSQMQSGLLCSSFSCVALLREALVYFYSLLRLQFTQFRVTQFLSFIH